MLPAKTNLPEISIDLKFLSNIYDAVPYYFMMRQRIRSNHNVQLPFAFTQCVIKSISSKLFAFSFPLTSCLEAATAGDIVPALTRQKRA